jgi:hypothetical protein
MCMFNEIERDDLSKYLNIKYLNHILYAVDVGMLFCEEYLFFLQLKHTDVSQT